MTATLRAKAQPPPWKAFFRGGAKTAALPPTQPLGAQPPPSQEAKATMLEAEKVAALAAAEKVA